MENLLNVYKTNRYMTKNIAGPTDGNEVTIFERSTGEAGVVTYLCIDDTRAPGVTTGWPEEDHHIKIYYDGSSTADIDTDLAIFFGYAYDEVYPAVDLATKHWHVHASGSTDDHRTGAGLKLPIPYQNGIKITIRNRNATAGSVLFTQVDYQNTVDNDGTTFPLLTVPPYRLHVIGNDWSGNRLSTTATQDPVLASIPAGNPGIIVGHSMAMGASDDYGYLERRMHFYMDGESTASFISNGTEDYFSGSYYFTDGESPFSHSWAMGLGNIGNAANTNPCPASALIDFLSFNGGFPFSSSCTVVWEHDPAGTVSSNTYGSALFYYRHT